MATQDKTPPVTLQELIVASLSTADALAKLLIDKGLITEAEYMDRLSRERGLYQRILERINSKPVSNA